MPKVEQGSGLLEKAAARFRPAEFQAAKHDTFHTSTVTPADNVTISACAFGLRNDDKSTEAHIRCFDFGRHMPVNDKDYIA
jgi:hypothetical protein